MRNLSSLSAVCVLAVAAACAPVAAPTSNATPPAAQTPTASPTRPSPTAGPTATMEASVVPPTTTAAGGLPVGPFRFEPNVPLSSEDSGMALTVSIPASQGWTIDSEWTFLSKRTESGDDLSIIFWAFPDDRFYVPADACRVTSTRPDTPATTVDEIATAMAAQASRDASEPQDVTVGGHEGKWITLHVPANVVPEECEEGSFVGYASSRDDFWFTAPRPGQIEDRWVLDVDGTILIIDATYHADTPAAVIEEMRAIVESTTFETP